jgi:hypothetical protein
MTNMICNKRLTTGITNINHYMIAHNLLWLQLYDSLHDKNTYLCIL